MPSNAFVPTTAGFRPSLSVTKRLISELKLPDRQVRKHSQKQIALIKKSIQRVGFTMPIVLGSGDKVLAGAARLAAAKAVGMVEVPTLSLAHLPEVDQLGYLFSDNKLQELATWDTTMLSLELTELAGMDLTFALEDLGFATAELDLLLIPASDDGTIDAPPPPKVETLAITRIGDVWNAGPHRLVCGDARDPAVYSDLMRGELARMVFADAPFNVPVVGHVMKRDSGRREFPMASGEMTPEEFTAFLTDSLGAAAAVSMDGSIHYACMDWRHLTEIMEAGQAAIGEMKNLIVWAKPNAGMGAFYRSQHELILVFKKGQAEHLNNFGLGKHRYRTNIWNYAGASGFHADRDGDLAMHPTAKPVAMIADAILDVSLRDEIVLDPFGGSGATLMAAERTGRRARLIELDPLYCDVICRRYMQDGGSVTLDGGGDFRDVVIDRRAQTAEAA